MKPRKTFTSLSVESSIYDRIMAIRDAMQETSDSKVSASAAVKSVLDLTEDHSIDVKWAESLAKSVLKFLGGMTEISDGSHYAASWRSVADIDAEATKILEAGREEKGER